MIPDGVKVGQRVKIEWHTDRYIHSLVDTIAEVTSVHPAYIVVKGDHYMGYKLFLNQEIVSLQILDS